MCLIWEMVSTNSDRLPQRGSHLILSYCVHFYTNPMSCSGADLSDADLRGADFSLANVTRVIFLSCYLLQSSA